MRRLLFATLLMATASASLYAKVYCYTLLDSSGKIVARSTSSQIDLSRKISDEVAEKYPRHHFVFGLEDDCQDFTLDRETNTTTAAAKENNKAATTSLLRRDDSESLSSDASNDFSGSGRSYLRLSSSQRSPGRDVQVKGFTRADGTTVQSYSRAARGRGR